MGATIMTRLATITSDCVFMPGTRMSGATVSENDYPPIDPDLRSTRGRFSSSWLPEIRDELDELTRLRAGWDSYDADPPVAGIVSAAKEFIEAVADPFRGLPRPSIVTATRNGGVQFEWGTHGGKYFELEFESPTRVEYLFVDPTESIVTEESSDFENNAELLGRVERFIGDAAVGL